MQCLQNRKVFKTDTAFDITYICMRDMYDIIIRRI